MSMICKKALSLSGKDRQKYTTGEITNLISVDAERILDSFPMIGATWAAPMSIVLAMYFLYFELKCAVFAGIGVLLILLPISIYGNKKGEFIHIIIYAIMTLISTNKPGTN